MPLRLVLLLSLLLALPVWAFGPHGHQAVAELAAQQLDPVARREVERLLGDRASQAMREASTWADEIRNEPEWRHTGPWHYLNFSRSQGCHYVAKRACREGRCVVGAIEQQVAVLGNRKAQRQARIEALRFVIHFVADVHQPLHAGYADDRGGNDAQVRFGREGMNLHGFWDQDLIRASRGGALRLNEHVRDLRAIALPTGSQVDYESGVVPTWAEASCRIVRSDGFYPAGGAIDARYVARFGPVLDLQIRLAGDRLASLLNHTLGSTP